MTDTCSCLPGACHGGHTIDVGTVTTTPPTDGDRSPQTTTDPLCPVCECGVVDDLVHIGHPHLGEIPAHGECTAVDEMLAAIWSARRAAENWQTRSREWHDRFATMRTKRNDLRARVTELEAERGQLHTDRMRADQRTIEAEQRVYELEAAQREPIGYGVIVEGADGVGGLWVQTSPLLQEADAVDRARFYGHQGARAVAMTEVGDR